MKKIALLFLCFCCDFSEAMKTLIIENRSKNEIFCSKTNLKHIHSSTEKQLDQSDLDDDLEKTKIISQGKIEFQLFPATAIDSRKDIVSLVNASGVQLANVCGNVYYAHTIGRYGKLGELWVTMITKPGVFHIVVDGAEKEKEYRDLADKLKTKKLTNFDIYRRTGVKFD
jgi:hypothetical protein